MNTDWKEEAQLNINLRAARLKQGFTQVEIANRVNISARAYQYLEYNKNCPKLKTALALAKVLNTTVEELFDSTKNNDKSH